MNDTGWYHRSLSSQKRIASLCGLKHRGFSSSCWKLLVWERGNDKLKTIKAGSRKTSQLTVLLPGRGRKDSGSFYSGFHYRLQKQEEVSSGAILTFVV